MAAVAGVEGFELVLAELPLRRPWRAASGDLDARPTIIVAAHRGGVTGWGECPALPEARYDGTDLETCWRFLADDLIPAVTAGVAAGGSADHRRRGPGAAVAAFDLAVLDLEARVEGRRLRDLPCLAIARDRTAVPAGVVVDDVGSVDATVDRVARHVEEGYRRVKLKVYPGHDLEWCRAVRTTWPDLCVGVDANGAYSPADVDPIRRLDALGLAFIEQPFGVERLGDHAALVRVTETPICLDESIGDRSDLLEVIAAGAADMVSLKWSRLGGLIAAADAAALAAEAGLAAFVGGMIEAGVGRAASTLLAAHPAMTVPGDLSASRRFFPADIVEPAATLRDGSLDLPDGAGLGVDVDVERLEELSVRRFAATSRHDG